MATAGHAAATRVATAATHHAASPPTKGLVGDKRKPVAASLDLDEEEVHKRQQLAAAALVAIDHDEEETHRLAAEAAAAAAAAAATKETLTKTAAAASTTSAPAAVDEKTESKAALSTTILGVETKDEELGKAKEEFRNYVDSAQQERVCKFYTEQHREMTFDVVQALENKYLSLDKEKFGIWEAMEFLCSLVDASDPDTDLSQMQHALQTAEAIRQKYPGEEYDWFHLVGLIHDLGKILSLSPKMLEPQWCTVGDTFPVGCAFSEKCVFAPTFSANPDSKHAVYSTKLGIYTEGCGLKNVKMSWGHDEYLYQVCVRNKSTLPDPALYMIRYHSFYPWHKEGAYEYLLDDKDREMLRWVKEFNQFDLYSKANATCDPEVLGVYYKKLIAKYFPVEVHW